MSVYILIIQNQIDVSKDIRLKETKRAEILRLSMSQIHLH